MVKHGTYGSADLYQMHAYAHRYGCRRVVLLYPWAAGAVERDFELLASSGEPSGVVLGIRFVNLSRDLYREADRAALADELEGLLREGLGQPAAGPVAEVVA